MHVLVACCDMRLRAGVLVSRSVSHVLMGLDLILDQYRIILASPNLAMFCIDDS